MSYIGHSGGRVNMAFLKKEEFDDENISLISADSSFQGTLDIKASVRIEGTLEGAIDNARTVIIAPGGKVKGDVSADKVIIAGFIKGNTCADHVEILSEANIEGDVSTKRIIIEEGAVVNGNFRVVGKEDEEMPEEQDEEEKTEE